MMSEWMRVMLEEIARKKAEADQARAEEQQRAKEQQRAEEKRRAEARQSVGRQHDAAELPRPAEHRAPAAGPDRARE